MAHGVFLFRAGPPFPPSDDRSVSPGGKGDDLYAASSGVGSRRIELGLLVVGVGLGALVVRGVGVLALALVSSAFSVSAEPQTAFLSNYDIGQEYKQSMRSILKSGL